MTTECLNEGHEPTSRVGAIAVAVFVAVLIVLPVTLGALSLF